MMYTHHLINLTSIMIGATLTKASLLDETTTKWFRK